MKRNIKGLTAAEVSESRKKHGTNALIKEKRRGFFKRFIENLADPIIKVLIGAVVLEVILTLGHVNFLEVGGIVVAVLIATVVSVVSEMGSERAFMRLRENGIGTSVTA